jgi:hypothetical protein
MGDFASIITKLYEYNTKVQNTWSFTSLTHGPFLSCA